MRRKWILLLLLTPTLTLACVAFPGKRTPQLPKPRVFPEVTGEPSIRLLVVNDGFKPKRVARSLQRARKKFPYLANAAADNTDPDYTIELYVETLWHESDFNVISGFMLGFIPSFYSRQVAVSAGVEGADGRRLGTFEATGSVRMVSQNHLLYILPLTGPLIPAVQDKVWKHTFRDVFIQVGHAIESDRRQRTGTADPGGRTSRARALPAEAADNSGIWR